MNLNLSLKDAYSWFTWILKQIVFVGLLIIFAAIVLSLFGFSVPNVRIPGFYDFALLAGAYWLFLK